MTLEAALRELTPKQRIFVERVAEGASYIEAARAAGYGSPTSEACRVAKHPKVVEALDQLCRDTANRMMTSRLDVERMLLDAYHNSESATEQIMAARELGKLHGHYAPTKTEQKVTHQGTITHEHDARKMTHAQLLEIAGETRRLSHDDPDTIEGEYEVVDG